MLTLLRAEWGAIVLLFSRQRMVNPRKAYPIDPGLIPIYEKTGRANLGHALETAVHIELLRRGGEVHYFRTPQGYGIDFHATAADGTTSLIQVCADASEPGTLTREIRSLLDAPDDGRIDQKVLILLEPLPSGSPIPKGVEIIPAIEWFLQSPE